jgi:hypothetical protein
MMRPVYTIRGQCGLGRGEWPRAAAVITTREAPDQLAARDGLVLGLAIEHLFDALVIALMQLIETDGLAAGSDHAADRKRN